MGQETWSQNLPGSWVLLGVSLFSLGGCVAQDMSYSGDASGQDTSAAIGDGQNDAAANPIEGRPCATDSDCETDTPCGVGVCLAGKCRLEPGPNGFVCDDNDICTHNDACFQGACIGSPIPCSDGNACTLDACDPTAGCVHAPTNQSCSDGDPCTAYQCTDGSCFAVGSACDDGNPCTQESCSGTLGCHTVALSGPACDDGNPCTLNDKCTFGACKGGGLCDDDNPCTADSCEGTDGCKHVNLEQICSDGLMCTNFDTCVNGACKGTVKTCDDGNPCTADTCDSANATCSNVPIQEGGACDDGNPCTYDTKCTQSVCSGVTKNCDDGDACTDDKCIFPSGQCLHTPSFKCGT